MKSDSKLNQGNLLSCPGSGEAMVVISVSVVRKGCKRVWLINEG